VRSFRCAGVLSPAGGKSPDENAFPSPISATRAVAPIGPMPGISASRRLASHERCNSELNYLKTEIYQGDVDILCRELTALDRFSIPIARKVHYGTGVALTKLAQTPADGSHHGITVKHSLRERHQ
jgi:hypothetical protein